MASHLSSLFELPFYDMSGGVTPESFPDPARTMNTSEPCYAEGLEMLSKFPEFRPNEPNSSISQFQPLPFDDAARDAEPAYGPPSTNGLMPFLSSDLETSTLLKSQATVPTSVYFSRDAPGHPIAMQFYHGPNAGGTVKDKKDRACLASYTNNKQCEKSNIPNFCKFCVEKHKCKYYCKDPIKPPRLVDTDICCPFSKDARDTRISDAQLSSFGNDAASDFSMERLEAPATRVIGCMTLFKRQHEMNLDSSLEHTLSTAYIVAYIVLDWLRRITFEASETFEKMYQEIGSSLVAPGCKKGFSSRRKKLAQVLGSTYKAIKGSMTTGYPLNVERLGFDLPNALEGLSSVVNGIDRKVFGEGKNTKLPEYSVKIFTPLTGNSKSEAFKLRYRDTDVKVSDIVGKNSHLFITMGHSTMRQSQTLHSDMNGDLNYSRAQASGLGLNLVPTEFSEIGQPPYLFSYSQYDAMNTSGWDIGVESSSPKRSTIQEVLESGTAPAIQQSAKYDLGRKPLVDQANRNEKAGPQSSVSRFEVPRKREFVDCSPRQAKRPRQVESPSDKNSPVAAPMSSSPAARRTKRGRPSVSLLSGSLLKHLVHGPEDHKTSHLLSQVLHPAKTLKKKKSQNLVSQVSQTSLDGTSGDLRRRRSDDWTSSSSNGVEGVVKTLEQLSMTV